MNELDRIVQVYNDRLESGVIERYSLFLPGELYIAQRREEASLRLLARQGIRSLRGMRILDVGCGRGTRIVDWLKWGAIPSSIYGIDLLEPFILEARATFPSAQFTVGSADDLPFESGSFDLVVQSTVFTSILDAETRRKVATELMRVVRPSGVLLWYDFRFPNPKNENVRPIRFGELKGLFPGRQMDVTSVTLLPPLARRLAPISMLACRAIESLFPVLRSHYLALIRASA